jgi:hypothetical protein
MDYRTEAGKRINPETAEVWFEYANDFDPYREDPEIEQVSVGRVFFAADPEERIAVEWSELPEETQAALDEKYRAADREGWERLISAIQAADEAAGRT